jgi:hypothetical protein
MRAEVSAPQRKAQKQIAVLVKGIVSFKGLKQKKIKSST